MAESLVGIAERTLLKIFKDGDLLVPLYSSRGLNEDLDLIEAADFQRYTVNYQLRNLARPQARKYQISITCTDQRPLGLSNLWPGDIIVIECVSMLSYRTGAIGEPGRPVVTGSSFTEGAFTFYRPRLTMMLKTRPQSTNEYSADRGWTLTARES